jgi:carboxymethylenebutenolidase
VGEMLRVTAEDDHELGIYRADPEGSARGALVIVQEIFGVNSHIRAVCDGFAAEGYLAVAPALFDRVEANVELGYTEDDVARGRALREHVSLDQALWDVEAAADLVGDGGKIGVVGYCWGGTVAWVAATRTERFAAVVGYYGGGIAGLAAEVPTCPVQLHFGEQDHAIPLTDVETITDSHPDIHVYLYPAGHGFNCDQRASFHADSANLARQRTLAFLRQRMG